MPIPPVIERNYLLLADTVFKHIPRAVPPAERLRQCRIIAHRGHHDNSGTRENSIKAFDRAISAGVWGIELDLRWTSDLEPVVFHDPDLLRLYGVPKRVADISYAELKKSYPDIPSLSEVIHRYGRKSHLMIEVKMQPWINQTEQVIRLEQALASLEPCADYHLITSRPEALSPFGGIPEEAKVAIAMNFPWRLSRWTHRRRWGGFCGHYSLIDARTVNGHKRLGQKVGTGYIESRNTLFREINRGIDWIFSNDACRMQQILDACLATGGDGEEAAPET